MPETCFVIMPIGNQRYDGIDYSEIDLKKKYDDLIKEAILKIKPKLQLFRADDISMPGSITNDIFTRLMHSNYVIADITLPNPNVYYELGIRHAIRAGTILIKDKTIKSNVFDISHLRYIEYENTSSGLKELSERLNNAFNWIDANPTTADNQFLELASFIKYRYPQFIDIDDEKRKKNSALLGVVTQLLKKPELMKLLIDKDVSQEEKNAKMLEFMTSDQNIAMEMISTLLSSGFIPQNQKKDF